MTSPVAALALLMPVDIQAAAKAKRSPAMTLMPLSFASILGGACTLIGTSTNLIVNGWLIDETEHPGLGMFDIAAVAFPVALVGIAFVLLSSLVLAGLGLLAIAAVTPTIVERFFG